jgi:hypothetical protein
MLLLLYEICVVLILVGHVLTAVNGIPVTGRQLDDGRDVFDVLKNEELFPLNLKFERPKMTTNEKIFLASMFYPLFAIASQLSPEPRSSGIEVLEADTFKLHCFQTLTGISCNRVYENFSLVIKSCSVHIYFCFLSVPLLIFPFIRKKYKSTILCVCVHAHELVKWK